MSIEAPKLPTSSSDHSWASFDDYDGSHAVFYRGDNIQFGSVSVEIPLGKGIPDGKWSNESVKHTVCLTDNSILTSHESKFMAFIKCSLFL